MSSGLTTTYLWPYPLQTDAVDVATDISALANAVETTMLLKAPILSPNFTGTPTLATSPNDADNSTKIATTAFVKNQGYLTAATATSSFAPLAGATFAGTVTMNNVPILFGDGSANEGRFVAASGVMYLQAGQSAVDTTGALVVSRNTTTATNIASFNVYADSHYVSGVTGIGVATSSSTFLNLAAGTTSVSPLRIAHGSAPTTPVNGDVWTTTTGMYARINGNTVGPFGTGGNWQSAAPTPAIAGMLWMDSDDNSFYMYSGTAWVNPVTLVTVPLAKTATYTAALADAGSLVRMNVGTNNFFYIPTNTVAPFPIGTSLVVVQTGAGQTTIQAVATGTTTVLGTPGLKLRTTNSVATIIKVDTETWIVTGDIIA